MSAIPSTWLTQEQVSTLTGWSARHIRRIAAEGKLEARESTARSRNGRTHKEYSSLGLPTDIQAKIAPPTQPALLAPSPLAIEPLFAGIEPQPVRALLVDKRDIALATKREEIIRPLIEYKAAPARFRQLCLTDGSAVTSIALLAEYLCQTHADERLTPRTLFRWLRAYKQHGAAGLARKKPANAGRSRWAHYNRDLADLAAYLYIGSDSQPGQSVMVCWEQVCRRAQQVGGERPSYETLRAFLQNPAEVSASMKTLQKAGKRGYEAKFAPFLKRGYTEPANQIWVSDHMICDCLVQDNCFTGDLQHIRLRMTTLMDYRSRLVVGVSWCQEGSSHSIKRALLQAILQHGAPEQFYCDNGKDYKKVARGAQRHELEHLAELAAEGETRKAEVKALTGSVMARLGIAVTFCLPFHPQSKHIEKYHRLFHERFDIAFPSYTAGKTHLRPDATATNLVQHKKLLRMGETRNSALPLASEYIAMAEHWIFAEYHNRPHSGEGMEGRSPLECFQQERNPHQRPAPTLEELVPLFAETTLRRVNNCAVEISGVRFVPGYGDDRAAVIMHERSGQQLYIAYDPLDMGRAVALDLDGFALCRLERQNLARFSQDEATRAEIAGISQQRGMLYKATRSSVRDLQTRVKGRGYTPLVAQMREAAGLPAAAPTPLAATGTDSIVQRPQKTARANESGAPLYVADAADAFFGDK